MRPPYQLIGLCGYTGGIWFDSFLIAADAATAQLRCRRVQSGIRRSDRRGPAASAERYSGTGSGSAQFDGQAAARPDGSADDSCGRFGGTCHPYSRSDGNGDSDCNPIAGTFGYPVPYRSTARISIKYAVSNSETRSDSYRHSCPCAAAYAAAGTDSDANTQPFAHSDPDADPIAIAFSNP